MTWNGKEIIVQEVGRSKPPTTHMATIAVHKSLPLKYAFGVSEPDAIANLVQLLYNNWRHRPIGYTLHPVMREAFKGLLK